MTKVLHISDLHFGAVDPRLPDRLLALSNLLAPDAVVVSGDLTQRARPGQFAAARDLLRLLELPVLAVPGNHDIPLFNLPLRLLAPFRRHAGSFGALEPGLSLPDAVIQGVNTANPLAWKSGRLRAASARHLAAAFAAAPADACRIAVMHHAPVPAADGTPADITDPAGVLARLAEAGAQIVLSGHTHMPHAGLAEAAAGILFVQVGTAISTRLKTDANDVSLLEITAGALTLRSWLARQGQAFTESLPSHFRRAGKVWTALSGG